MAGVLRRWGPWILLAAVASVALALGLRPAGRPSLDNRVQSIASQVRCPVCDGETVAESQAAPSLAIRSQIRREVQAGASEGQILGRLVRDYGPAILEKPQPKGFDLVVWVLPVVAAVAAGGALVVILRRGRLGRDQSVLPDRGDAAAAGSGAPAVSDPSPSSDPSSAGGSLAGSGLATAGPPRPGRAKSARLHDVEHPVGILAGSVPAPDRTSPGRDRSVRRRRVLTGLALAGVAGGASWAVVGWAGTRLPGQEITGQALPAQTVTAALIAASTDAQNNDAVGAMKEYAKVLKADPNQVEALTGMGWVLIQTGQPGLLHQGLAQLASAERIDPSYGPAHLYRGLGLLGEGDYGGSAPELQWYLDHNPDPQLAPQVQKALAQARAAGASLQAGG